MPKTHPKAVESTDTTPVIIIVEDNVLVRESLRDMLEQGGFTVDDYPTGDAFLDAYRPGRGACLLIDARLPGLSGLDVLRQLKRQGATLPSIMITGASDITTAVEAMKAGAANFIQKPISQRVLVDEVERVIEQSRDANTASTRQKEAADRLAQLTSRQREVLRLIVDGQANKVIAMDLGISLRTVENHRALIMKKTGAKSLPDLTRIAFAADSGDQHRQTSSGGANADAVQALSESAGAMDSDQFGRYFDQMPLAIIIAEMAAVERIVYANPAYERVSGQAASDLYGKPWDRLVGQDIDPHNERSLGAAIASTIDCVGTFTLRSAGSDPKTVEAYSNVIADDDGKPVFRLAALVDVSGKGLARLQEFEQQMLEKDALLLEIQHRVKNNLQMITALIRAEARNVSDNINEEKFSRLAGRINSIQIIYRLLSDFRQNEEIDLGVYLSEIASSVMHSHGTEGISLNLNVDNYPVSVNVALPTGLVANELLTNALKHAFVGRDHGTITLKSLSDHAGYRVTIADDGIGLPPGVEWPKRGKLGELIVRSLRQNAKADLKLISKPGKGTSVTISFTRSAARANISV